MSSPHVHQQAASSSPTTLHTPVLSFSALPSTLIPLICHYLPLRQLLVWSTVSRFVRSVVYPVSQSPAHPTQTANSTAGECWRHVASVRLWWGPETSRGQPGHGLASLAVNGAILPPLTATLDAALKAELRSKQPKNTIAEAFANASLSPPRYDTSLLDRHRTAPPLPVPPHIPYPLIPPLAAIVRSLRFIRRVEYSTGMDDTSGSALLTVLTVLPSFPLLSHFSLQCDPQFSLLADDQRDSIVSGIFGCLLSLPHLTSLSVEGHIPVMRRLGEGGELDFAYGALGTLLDKRLLHISLNTAFFSRWSQWSHQSTVTVSRQAAADGSVRYSKYASLQSLRLTGEGEPVGNLVELFPSLMLLDARVQHNDVTSFLRLEQRQGLLPSWDGPGPSASSCGISSSSNNRCALRFLKTSVQVKGLPEIRVLARFDFLYSLHLAVFVQGTEPQRLAPLSSLASLSQLRELTMEVSGGNIVNGIWQLEPNNVFDLTWLDELTQLRYLHIKAFRYTSLATLHSLQLLHHSPPQSQPKHTTPCDDPHPPPSIPRFVSRVEEFGLDVYEQYVGVERAAEFEFDAWTRLERCAVRYISGVDFGRDGMGRIMEQQHISEECETANAILRERVGAARWVSEEQLVSGRLDSRWKAKMGMIPHCMQHWQAART